MRSFASSNALVTLASLPSPVSRMNRLRTPCRSKSMKMTRTTTKPAALKASRILGSCQIPPGSGFTTTGRGLVSPFGV